MQKKLLRENAEKERDRMQRQGYWYYVKQKNQEYVA
jgi:uncharacterized protein YcgL (UPF0745 family)